MGRWETIGFNLEQLQIADTDRSAIEWTKIGDAPLIHLHDAGAFTRAKHRPLNTGVGQRRAANQNDTAENLVKQAWKDQQPHTN